MASTNDLKNGMVLSIDNGLWSVVEFQHVKPGKGGVVASRLMRAPGTPFWLLVEHSIGAQRALLDIDVLVKCAGQPSAILEANLVRQGNGYRIDNLPSDCAFIEIAIAARAWSGRSALNENIEAVEVVRQ